jgi:hypothetical protein
VTSSALLGALLESRKRLIGDPRQQEPLLPANRFTRQWILSI